MARIKASDFEQQKQNSNTGYFRLVDDGDTARVRFLYNTSDDIEMFSVYQVDVNGKKRWVNSLRNYNEPLEKCPFSRLSGVKLQNKLFIPIYNIDENCVQIWERGFTYQKKLEPIAKRFEPIYSAVVEISRSGRKGDKETTYNFFLEGRDDNFDISKVDVIDPLGTIILDKSYEEMEYYVNNGCFPEKASGGVQQVQRRSPSTIEY